MQEVGRVFHGEMVSAYIGGLHLFRLSDKEVRDIAGKIRDTGIKRIITGHCTGEQAYFILKSVFGNDIDQFHCGMEIEL